ncbi:MAG: polysaccharide pyruvyl transferase family protein [Verrucomicrobiales bacterium]|nr:polysaccharide pyruvyl transferase family protein [Verrucomicrobiales bacterium]
MSGIKAPLRSARRRVRRGIEQVQNSMRFLRQRKNGELPHLIYVGGWHNHANLGDEALIAAYRRILPGFHLVEYMGGWTQSLLKRLYPPDQPAVLGGGTLINYGHGWTSVTESFLATQSNIACFGTGVQDTAFFAERDPRWEDRSDRWKRMLGRFRYLGVRGPLSAKAIAEWGMEAEVIGDPVLSFARETPDPRPVRPKTLGLNISSSTLTYGSTQSTVDEFARLASLAKGEGWMVEWHVVYPEDLPLTRLAAESSGTQQAIIENYTDTLRFISDVGQLTAFAGTKLHAVILSVCAAVPSFMVEYQPKCRDFMLSVEQGEASVRADQFRAASAWQTIRPWADHREQFQSKLLASVVRLKKRQLQRAAEIFPSPADRR